LLLLLYCRWRSTQAALRFVGYGESVKHATFVVGLVSFLCVPALAQQGPPPGPGDGPPPPIRQRMDEARDAARTRAIAALSTDHQTKVSAILARIKTGGTTDPRDAVRQIDAILSSKEAQAILAARDKMIADLRAAQAGQADSSGPPPPGPPPPGPPGGGFGGPPSGAGFVPGGGPPGGGFGGPPGGGGFAGPPGGAGFDGPPGGDGHRGMQRMRDDAGFALLTLSLDRDQMRALMGGGHPPH
jgi:hypothetical protein